MSTKNIVPRESGEGQLGTSLKIWKEIHQLTSSFGTANFKENSNNVLMLSDSPLIFNSGLSGSLTKLADGSSYLIEGTNISVTSGSSGQVSIGLVNSPTIGGNLTVVGDLTIQGSTTTIDTQNLLVEDPLILLSSNSTTTNQNGGLAILSGSSVPDESLVIGRVANDIWGVGRMDVQSGAVSDLSGMTSVSFKAADLISTTGVISGSSNKAIEFDSLGNILTLTTGSVVEHNVLAYDGTKWVASASLGSGTSGVDNDAVASMFVSGSHSNISFEHDEVNDVLNASVSMDDAITVTYSPNLIYATMKRTSSQSLAAGWNVLQFQSVYADTSPNTDIANTANNRLVVPAGVTKVKVSAAAHGNVPSGISGEVIFEIRHFNSSGSQINSSPTTRQDVEVRADEFVYAATSIVPVSEGDYFDVLLYSQYAQTSTAPTTGRSNWFTLEVVEGSILNTVVNTTIPDMMTVTYTPNVVHARMTLSADQSLSNNTIIQFNTVDVDTTTGNILTDTANNRLVVPAGVSKVKIKGGASLTSSWNGWVRLEHFDSTDTKIATTEHQSNYQANTTYYEMPIVISSIVDVQQGDYFKLRVYGNGTIHSTSLLNQTFVEMEVVEGSILNTTVNSTISDFTADTLTLSEGVISGSNNKAIEFDSLGNITTLTTGSAVEHNVLAYDGTKWVASASLGSGTSGVDTDAVASMFVSGSHTNITFEHDEVNDVLNASVSMDDAITVTYTPKSVYATMAKTSSQNITNSLLPIEYNVVRDDTSPGGVIADITNHRMVIPAGVDKVKASAAFFAPSTHNGDFLIYITHYDSAGNAISSSPTVRVEDDQANDDWLQAFTSIVSVNQGDYFQARVLSSSGYTFGATSSDSSFMNWFTLEVVEGSILNTTVNSTISDFTADTLTLSEGVISGSNNKAIEFDADGNITTLTTGSASTNSLLYYDGAKWDATTSPTIPGSLTVTGDLTVNGTTTTIDTQNLVVEDPLVLLASNSTTSNQDGGLAILSGSSVTDESLVIGRVDTDMWGVGRMDVQSGAVTDLSGMTSVDFKAADLVSTTGVISGSSNKAIEFDSLGNITTLTTGSVSANDVLTYDGTKWVADTLQDAMTVTYSPNKVYARLGLTADTAIGFINGNFYINWDKSIIDTSPNSNLVDTTKTTTFTHSGTTYTRSGALVVPAGVSKVKLRATIYTNEGTTGECGIGFHHFDSSGNGKTIPATQHGESDTYQERPMGFSGIVDVEEGDYFVLLIGNWSNYRTVRAHDGQTWFEIEVVEGSILNTVVNTTIPDMMTVTYQPTPIYARLTMTSDFFHNASVDQGTGYTSRSVITTFNTRQKDTSDNNLLTSTLADGKFIIPAGVSKVKIKASAEMNNTFSGIDSANKHLVIYKNGQIAPSSVASNRENDTGSTTWPSLSSAIIDVVENDYIQIGVHAGFDVNVIIDTNYTWFEMEVVEGSILNTTVNSTISDFSANKLTLSEGVISGSNNKAIEFDSLGNILTLTTGSAVEHNVLAYDGTKWVASASLGSGTSGVDNDAVASMFVSGTHDNITFTYDENNEVINTTISDLSANTLTLSQGVISGSSNKAIEFDSLGNITTLTTGSVSTNDVLTYDGTKWVADTLQDTISVTYVPERRYALMTPSATYTHNSGDRPLVFGTVIQDTDSLADITNNRFVIPASGITKVKLKSGVYCSDSDTGQVNLRIYHYNSSGVLINVKSSYHETESAGADGGGAYTPITDVSPGDYFVSQMYTNANRTVHANYTWFEIEVVEGSILNTTVNTTIPDMMTVTYQPSPVYAIMSLSADVTVANSTSSTTGVIPFDTVEIDTSTGNVLTSTSNGRMTIPAGVTKVELEAGAHAYYPSSQSSTVIMITILHFNSSNVEQNSYCGSIRQTDETGWADIVLANTSIVEVQQGDYFHVIQSSTVSREIDSNKYTYFQMKVVEGSILNTTVNSTISDFTADTLTLSQGVISGSNNKAIEFDSSGNITSFGQSTPSQHDLLAYDGAKWVATGSIDQFFELDGNGDLMPI